MATTTISAGSAQPLPDGELADLTTGQLPGGQPAPAPASAPLGAAWAQSLATGLALIVCVVARLPHRMVEATGIRSWGFTLLVAVCVVSGVRALARAPFTLPGSLRAGPDRSAALRRWAVDELKIVAATTAVGTLVSLPLYMLLRATPAWWLPAWLMFAALTVLWQVAMPLVLRLRASSSTPTPPALERRVQDVAVLAGVDVGDVIVTGRPGAPCGNAYVVGLGRTRRVVLEHALVAWPPELVDQVVAHELGHWRLGHGARRLPLTLLAELAALAATAAVLSFAPLLDHVGVAAAGDPRSYPLLLVLGAAVALPVRCLLAWQDRAQERAADRFALDLLDRPDHFDAMLQRAADHSGTPRRLPWWRRLTASHPPIDERVAACRQVRPPVLATKGS